MVKNAIIVSIAIWLHMDENVASFLVKINTQCPRNISRMFLSTSKCRFVSLISGLVPE